MSKPRPTASAGDAAQTVQTPAPTAPDAWPADQYTGLPGTYVRDPATGQRTPVPAAEETPQT